MGLKMKGECPACGSHLSIARYACTHCGTEISGEFDLCQFCKLGPELQHFITVFLVRRGNIKLVERDLGISYPTVRKELKRVIEALGYSADEDASVLTQAEKLSILDKLDKGEIDYEAAMSLLDGREED